MLVTKCLRHFSTKVRLSRNMCLLLTAILHFIHGMTDPVLMSLSASHVSSFRRHFPVLLVSVALFVLPVALSFTLWHHYALNTWLFAVTAFCVELCLKVSAKRFSLLALVMLLFKMVKLLHVLISVCFRLWCH